MTHSVRAVTRSRNDEVIGESAIPVDEFQCHHLRLKRGQPFHRWVGPYRRELAIGFHLRRLVHGKVEVRHIRVGIEHRAEDVIEFGFCHCHSSGGFFRNPRNLFLSIDREYASSGLIIALLRRSMIASSSVCIPYFFPTCSMPGI